MFDPIQVGHLTLPNRIMMGSMHTGLEEEKGGMEALARFYADRAEGGAALMVTGGISPNREGALAPLGACLNSRRKAVRHRVITKAVHEAGGRICMQILHGGRYSYHPLCVAPSAIKAPIARFRPRALSSVGIRRTIRAFVKSAKLARHAGYDGVEIMGSEGYLINQFIAKSTNKRTDGWGGSFENRIRFALEIIRGIRAVVGEEFVIIYRLSMLDLVSQGSDWNEVVQLAKEVETAGANMINTGIGWHEARIPTIATLVPRGGFSFVTKRLMGEVDIPLVTTNRFNDPVQCESALAEGAADMISMARPFLADADIVKKSEERRAEAINTCIGCNQACLDHVFKNKVASCLVNPRAAHESVWPLTARAVTPLRVAVVGSGPAGLSCAVEAARLGHAVTLFEASDDLGGQFNLAKRIPGKEEFYQTLRYFEWMLGSLKVQVRKSTVASADLLDAESFDHVVVATGVKPRFWSIEGSEDDPRVVNYVDVLNGVAEVGENVAIIGAGGIGFDVADYLTHDGDKSGFWASWGIDVSLQNRGGLVEPSNRRARRTVHMFQRSPTKLGKGLGKTTGWIHRKTLKDRGVTMHPSTAYHDLSAEGLTYSDANQSHVCLPVDTVVVCAGQIAFHPLFEACQERGVKVERIGGALDARGLDAQRAIREGLETAYAIAPWSS